MEHAEHVDLLRPANLPPGGLWADFGAGSGAFTLALRELIGPAAMIYALDKDLPRLDELEHAWHARFGDVSQLRLLPGDFTRTLALPPLDGVLMANSLHFFKEKHSVLRHVHSCLKPGGALLLVEYNVDTGNTWVPYPFSFQTWQKLAPQAGFGELRLLATRPSGFLRGFYSALAQREEP